MPWMTDLYNMPGLGFQNRSLHEITIPGTHDAGCYVDHVYGNGFARTQIQDVAGQLGGGIRYFDIRPYQANYVIGRSFWTYHGNLPGNSVFYSGGQVDGDAGILAQVANFMNGLGPASRELVILNISHFRAFDNNDHQALINAITGILGNHLVPYTQAQINLFDAPYWQLLANPAPGGGPPLIAGGPAQSRVAILYDGALDTVREGYINANVNALPAGFFTLTPKYAPAANQIFLFDQYANKFWVDDGLTTTGMRTDQLNKLRNRTAFPYATAPWGGGLGNWPTANAAGGVASTLHLFSWTLTPQARPSMSRDPVYVAQHETNPALLDVFNGPNRGWTGAIYDPGVDPKINIIYVDNYASQHHRAPGSPWNNLPLPVAISARLNVGPLTW